MTLHNYLVPVSPNRNVYLQGPFPLTEEEWERFLIVLNAMQPGLVKDPPETEVPTPIEMKEDPQ